MMRLRLAAIVAAAILLISAAPDGGNDFHFSILGDRTGGAQPGIYGRIWREIDLLHPDFVINVGDTIQGGNDETAASEWAELRPLRDTYRYPWYFVAGNHDVWSAASLKMFEKETGRPAHYSFNSQNAHFTVLDNSRSDELSVAQLAFLEKDLAANATRSPKFVFFHRPFWALYIKMRSGEFPLHRIARKYGVNYIVSGHAHFFMRMERDGIAYLGVGSSGASMERGRNSGLSFAEGWFYHHIWVRVRGDKAEFTVKELTSSGGRGRMFRAEDWDTNGPRFNPADPAIGAPLVR
jgi:3',5'-cyclic-AMP phosphodiesterase